MTAANQQRMQPPPSCIEVALVGRDYAPTLLRRHIGTLIPDAALTDPSAYPDPWATTFTDLVDTQHALTSEVATKIAAEVAATAAEIAATAAAKAAEVAATAAAKAAEGAATAATNATTTPPTSSAPSSEGI